METMGGAEIGEVASTLEHVREVLDQVVVRGLRASGAREVAALESHAEALERAGAQHLAGALRTVARGVESGERSAARELLRARASVRLFERLLTLRAAGIAWDGALSPSE